MYRLDLKSFELADNMIFWNNATALLVHAPVTPGVWGDSDCCVIVGITS